MDRGAWWAIVHGFTKESDTIKQLSTHILLFYFPITFNHLKSLYLCLVDIFLLWKRLLSVLFLFVSGQASFIFVWISKYFLCVLCSALTMMKLKKTTLSYKPCRWTIMNKLGNVGGNWKIILNVKYTKMFNKLLNKFLLMGKHKKLSQYIKYLKIFLTTLILKICTSSWI